MRASAARRRAAWCAVAAVAVCISTAAAQEEPAVTCPTLLYDPPPRGAPPPPLKTEGAGLVAIEYPDQQQQQQNSADAAGNAAAAAAAAADTTPRRTPVTLRGANWFGFNTAYGGPEGLWIHNAPDAVSDYFTALRQLRALGFNALRLPFHFGDLEMPASSAKGPPLARCRRLSEWQTRRRVTDPRVWRSSASASSSSSSSSLGPLPPSPVTQQDADAVLAREVAAAKRTVARAMAAAGPGADAARVLPGLLAANEALGPALGYEDDAREDPSVTRCNAGFPGRFPFVVGVDDNATAAAAAASASAAAPGPQPTVLDRYLWTVQAAVAHGFYVILSYHPASTGHREAERLAADQWGPAGFAAAWVALWRRLACLPHFDSDLKGRLLLDLMNEPDSLGLQWGEPLGSDDSEAAVRAALGAAWQQEPYQASAAPAGGGGVRLLPPPSAAAARAALEAPEFSKPAGWSTLALAAMEALYAVSMPSWREQTAWARASGPPPPAALLPGTMVPSSAAQPAAVASAAAAAEAAAAAPPPAHLLLIEGTGQTALGLNWGNGFAVDPAVLASRTPPLSDARPFFSALLEREPPALRARVALAPHAYPPTISRGPEDALTDVSDLVGGPLWRALDQSFGFAARSPGVCVGGGGGAEGEAGGSAAAVGGPSSASPPCAVFPVILGEFGSRFLESADLAWLEDMAGWLRVRGRDWAPPALPDEAGGSGGKAPAPAAPPPPSAPLAGWVVWAFNANSGDTGGLVRANWHGFEWPKLRFLVDAMGLRPWYYQQLQAQGEAAAAAAAAAPAKAALAVGGAANGGGGGVAAA